jgi:outer membrane protein TolC
MKKLVFIVTAVSISWTALCQSLPTDPNSPVTLESYLQVAAANNAELKSSYEEWRIAMLSIPQARALPDPEMRYEYLARQSDMQMGQTVSVMQMFPWFGTIDARTEAAVKTAAAAQQGYRAAQLAVFKEVKESFYEYQYLAGAIAIAQENLKLLEHFEQIARAKYETATATHPDVIRAQVEMAKMENVLNGLTPMRKPVMAKLNALMNRPVEADLPWPTNSELSPASISRQLIYAMVKTKNPQLSELDLTVAAAREKIKEARKRFYPDVGMGVEWQQFDKSGDSSGRDAVALMFQINLPLWRGSYRAGEQQARSMARMVSSQRTEKENTLLSQAEKVLYDLENSDRQLRLYRDVLIPKTEELLAASETAYQAATVDFLTLIDAQRMLLEYKLEYQQAVRDYRQTLAELELLTGGTLPQLQQN